MCKTMTKAGIVTTCSSACKGFSGCATRLDTLDQQLLHIAGNPDAALCKHLDNRQPAVATHRARATLTVVK